MLYQRQKSGAAGDKLKKVHPLGQSPTMVIKAQGSEPVVLVESAVIITYVVLHVGAESGLSPKRYLPGQEGVIGGEIEEWKPHSLLCGIP
jgi:glutathione S-transferase